MQDGPNPRLLYQATLALSSLNPIPFSQTVFVYFIIGSVIVVTLAYKIIADNQYRMLVAAFIHINMLLYDFNRNILPA